MHIGKKNSKIQYKFNSVSKLDDQMVSVNILEQCKSEKDLGITFDPSLLFDLHIQAAINKANKMSGIIKRSFDFIQEDTFVQLYKTMLRPHLEYGNVILSLQLKRQSVAIEKVQRRATKLVKSCKNLPYEKRIQILNLNIDVIVVI